VWIDTDGDGKPDIELTDAELLARLFPPEVVEMLRKSVIEDKDT